MKKIIAWTLLFSLLLLNIPIHVPYAEEVNDSVLYNESYIESEYKQSDEYKAKYYINYYIDGNDDNGDFEHNSIPHYININDKKLYFNVELHKEKAIQVYGYYGSVFLFEGKNDFKTETRNSSGIGYYEKNDIRGEYRHHGYALNGILYSNDDFPRDSDSGRSVSEKKWIYHHWDEVSGQDASKITLDATNEKNPKYTPLRKQIDDMVDDVLLYSTYEGLDKNNPKYSDYSGQGKAVADHMNIYTINSTLYNGEGKMYQRNAGRLWYQMFSTEVAKAKDKKNQAVVVEILDKGTYKIDATGRVAVSVKVIGQYLDSDIISDSDKVLFYNQEELKRIHLSLAIGNKSVVYSGRPNTVVNGNTALEHIFELEIDKDDIQDGLVTATGKSYTSFYGANKSEVVNDEVSALDVDTVGDGLKSLFDVKDVQLLPDPSDPSKTLPFTVDMLDYKDYSTGDIETYEILVKTGDLSRQATYTYIGQPIGFVDDLYDFITVDDHYESYIVYQTVKNSRSSDRYYDAFSFRKEVKQAIELDFDIPHHVIDIDPVEASDNTNYGGQIVKSKSIIIDGDEVDWDDFFDGKFSFGETHNNYIADIVIKVVNDQDVESTFKEAFNVHSSLPRSKLVAEGTLKENRLVTLYNKSSDVEDPFVAAKYPNSYTISYTSVDGLMNDWKMKPVSENEIDMIFKSPGFYKATIVASNDARSESTSTDYHIGIVPDYEPNVYFNIWNNVLTRNETLNITYSADSLDGDRISFNHFQVYFDEDNDGIAEKLIHESEGQLNFFTPTMLGFYKIVNNVSESYGEATIEAFLTEEDKRTKKVERVFYVDNLRPLVEIDLDIPESFQKVDMYIMSDENLGDGDISELRESRVDYNNDLRLYGLDVKADYRDLKTYVQSQQIDTSDYSGDTYPSATLTYSSSGFIGVLSRYNVINNSYEDYYTTEESYESCKTVNVFNGYVNCDSACLRACNGIGNQSGCNSGCCDKDYRQKEECKTKTTTKRHYYTVNRYTGYYSGTVYKSVKQAYANPFRETSDKYLVYIADDTFNLDDFNIMKSRAHYDVILIGDIALKNAVSNEVMFIENDGSGMDNLMKQAIDYIGSKYPFSSKYLVEVGDTFTLSQIMFDTEGDPLTNYGYQYVQDQVFDNPMGLESFASVIYKQAKTNFSNHVAASFSKVGLFKIYALLKDNTGQVSFDKESNVSEVSILVHRKPIADYVLDWTYDASSSMYQTIFVDQSYDLDHEYSDDRKGIRDVKAMYRNTLSSVWIYAVPDKLSAGTYEFRYSVKDMEGAWSDPKQVTFTLSDTPPPQLLDAKVKVEDNRFSLNGIPGTEYLRFFHVKTRYPYDHDLVYRWLENGRPVSSYMDYIGDYSLHEGDRHYDEMTFLVPKAYVNGDYEVELCVRDSDNSSNSDARAFDIVIDTPIDLITFTPDMILPGSNTFECETSKYVDEVQLTIYYGSPYAETYKMTKVDDKWFYDYEASDLEDGFYDVHYRAIIHSSPYQDESKIDQTEKVSLRALNISIVGAWTYWDGGENIFGETLTDEPHRFMSLERIDIYVETIGEPDDIQVTMSDELMAMTYVDKNNNTYNYEEMVGSKVLFPILMSTSDKSNWTTHYVLPLTDSTKDLENNRLKSPYWIKIVLRKGTNRLVYLVDDIEISGNTIEHLYLQPQN
ncbi:hypothetical protein EZV73_05285 [Acidaminobacter sp. JC074]|uniref:Athe_2463 domain-containing protein n=1 Tax=Acidaminobacter sp. JC074 TaxID=2530199 RepID=UPI001F10EEEA|nr:hypothetical protein [Acidaminobacter sp. JC074]MCH4886969.1 hypothetical protein [Acidaminobacter sp. JC074]